MDLLHFLGSWGGVRSEAGLQSELEVFEMNFDKVLEQKLFLQKVFKSMFQAIWSSLGHFCTDTFFDRGEGLD